MYVSACVCIYIVLESGWRIEVPNLNVTNISRIFFLVVIPSRTSYQFRSVIPQHTRLSSIFYITRRKCTFWPNFLPHRHDILFTIIWVTLIWFFSERYKIFVLYMHKIEFCLTQHTVCLHYYNQQVNSVGGWREICVYWDVVRNKLCTLCGEK